MNVMQYILVLYSNLDPASPPKQVYPPKPTYLIEDTRGSLS
jgi:hypothetical protein